jgi:hypothetical protein
MVFYHKPYPNYTNPNEKINPRDICLNSKKYTKYTNYMMQNKKLKKTYEIFKKPKFKTFGQ